MSLTIVVITLCMLGSGFFSMSETALLSASRAKLFALMREGSKPARKVLKMLDNPEKLLATILIGNNIVNILGSAVVTGLLIRLFGEAGVLYATATMTTIIILFCEILPKTVAARYPVRIALMVCHPLKLFMLLFTPLTWLVQHFNWLVFKLFRTPSGSSTASTSELRGAIHLSLQQGAIKRSQHLMLDAILELDNLTVADVMLHRSAIEALDVHTTPADIPARLAALSHTRVPVYEGSPENILGILTVRDYLAALSQVPNRHAITIRSHLQPAYYIPETTTAAHQLRAFLKTHKHMALVVDEYGGLEGLITLEDILEEIVGNIGHENEPIEPAATPDEKGRITLPGEMPIRTANRLYGWDLSDDNAVTLAGLMIDALGHLPTQGESITLPTPTGSYTFSVADKRGQRLQKITITPPQPSKK